MANRCLHLGEFLAVYCQQSYMLVANIRKKVVKNNEFWKINAIWPIIKAKRERMRKFKNGDNAKYGGVVKELGF